MNKKAIGKRIRDIRMSNKMKNNATMEEFAELIDSNKSNVSRWERGDNIPNEVTLRKIAELGDTTVDYILYGSPYGYIYSVLKNDFNKKGYFYDRVFFAKQMYESSISKVTIKEFEEDDDNVLIQMVANRVDYLLKNEYTDEIYTLDDEIIEVGGKEVLLIVMERDISLENIINEHIESIKNINPINSNFTDYDNIEEIADFLSLTETDLSKEELLVNATHHFYKDEVYKKKTKFIEDLVDIQEQYNQKLKEINRHN